MQQHSIGQASRLSNVKIPTIRYYEQIGLLSPLPRNEGNRRSFDNTALKRLTFIRHARGLGFDIVAIRTLLQLQDEPEQCCNEADTIARNRLADVEHRIHALFDMRRELKQMIYACPLNQVSECRIIAKIAQ